MAILPSFKCVSGFVAGISASIIIGSCMPQYILNASPKEGEPPSEIFEMGDYYMKQGDWHNAARYYEDQIEATSTPNRWKVYAKITACYYRLADESFRRIEIMPEEPASFDRFLADTLDYCRLSKEFGTQIPQDKAQEKIDGDSIEDILKGLYTICDWAEQKRYRH